MMDVCVYLLLVGGCFVCYVVWWLFGLFATFGLLDFDFGDLVFYLVVWVF